MLLMSETVLKILNVLILIEIYIFRLFKILAFTNKVAMNILSMCVLWYDLVFFWVYCQK